MTVLASLIWCRIALTFLMVNVAARDYQDGKKFWAGLLAMLSLWEVTRIAENLTEYYA